MRSLIIVIFALFLYELLSLGCMLQYLIIVAKATGVLRLTQRYLIVLYILSHLVSAGLLYLFTRLGRL